MNNADPYISIIIPLFNKEGYIEKCLRSIVSQTEKNWECIIVDDGSTDGSVQAAEGIIGDDSRFKLFSQKNSGPSVARNRGIKESSGRILHFIDADDFYPTDTTLKDVIAVFDKYKPKALTGNIGILYSETEEIDYTIDVNSNQTGWFKKEDVQYDYYFTRFFFERNFIIENKIAFPEYTYVGEDPVFLLRALEKIDRFFITSIPVYVYNIKGSANNDFRQYSDAKVASYIRSQNEVIDICLRNGLLKLVERVYDRILNEFIDIYADRSKESPEVKERLVDLISAVPFELKIDKMALVNANKKKLADLEEEFKKAKSDLKSSTEMVKRQKIELEVYRRPGVKLAFKTFLGAVKRYISKS